ncbi:BatA domain-containing protein [Novilysobacter erysipheiresistens]|uniref:BatA domain-containing protein n=1 Tax=Novilysobacter erysipheiresistens TaxID=1749332 RepID=A0ABU7YWC7_9GAMM
MTVSLLLPIGLSALAALLLPLLVHLARRSEQRLVVFAALRWLQAKAQPQRKHRFDEILLLVLRLLLLAALALLLAGPVLFGRPDRTARVLVAPGVDAAAVRDRIGADDARWHWAAPGFPVIDEDHTRAPDRPPADAPSFSSLLREMDATLPAGTPLTVLVPPVLVGADAERPRLSRRVEWRIVSADGRAAIEPPVPSTTAIPTLMVRHAPERADSLRYLRAAGAAWLVAREDKAAANPVAPVTIAPASTPLDPDQPHLVWLVPGPLPNAVREWIAAGGEALLDADTVAPELAEAAVVWRGPDSPLARAARLGRGRIMQLQHELRPAAMPVLLEPDFPIQLQRLFTEPPPAPTRVEAAAHAPRMGLAAYPETPRPLAPWLAVLVALLFLLERWVANGPRRRPAA